MELHVILISAPGDLFDVFGAFRNNLFTWSYSYMRSTTVVIDALMKILASRVY
jgi:hypothetical protein